MSFMTFNAQSMSCMVVHEILIKCENSKCQEGLILPKKATEVFCDEILNLNGSEKIRPLDPNLFLVKHSLIKDGYYIIQCHGLMDYKIENFFQVSKDGFLTGNCLRDPQSPFKVVPQNYPLEMPINEIQKKLVFQSKIQWAKNLLINWILPLLVVMCLLGIKKFGRRHETKLIVGLIFISCFGLSQLFFGRFTWIWSSLIGIVISIGLLIRRFFKRSLIH